MSTGAREIEPRLAAAARGLPACWPPRTETSCTTLPPPRIEIGYTAGRPELAAAELAAAELAAAELAAAELAADRLEAESEGTIDGDFGDWLPRKARFWSSR